MPPAWKSLVSSNRREWLLGGVGGLCAVVAACRPRDTAASKAVLRVATGPDRYNFSPGRFTFTLSRPNVHLAEPPVRPDANFEARPWLFESWRHEGKGSFVVKLRQGVEFHDGTLLTAEVFLQSAARFISTRDFIGLDPASLRAVDEFTVRFRSLDESALMVDNMTHPVASVLLASADYASRPIGTGPYRLVHYEPQRWLEVERFERYWGPKPAQPRVRYRFLADPQARLLALQAGEVDVVADVPPEMLAGLTPENNRVRVHTSRPIRYAALLCNLHGEPPFHCLRDVRVRRALALAIDRPAIARTLYMGRGVVARGVLPGWMFGLGDQQPTGFDFDPRRAADLLDAAGWRRGEDGLRRKGDQKLRLRLVAAFPSAAALKPLPEMLGQMLHAVGVELEIIEVNDDQLYYSAYADRGQADLFLELAANANSDPTFLLRNVFHSRTPWRAYRFHAPGPDIDDLLDQARRGPDRRFCLAAVWEAHRRIVDTHIAAIPIVMVPVMILTRPQIVLQPFENADWINYGQARKQV